MMGKVEHLGVLAGSDDSCRNRQHAEFKAFGKGRCRSPSAETEMSSSDNVSRQVATKSTYAGKSSPVLQNALMLLKPRPSGAFKSDLTILASMRRRSNFPPYLPLKISPASSEKPAPLKVQSEKSSRLGSCSMISSTWTFVTDTNFIVSERMEMGSFPMVEIHSRFSHLPPIKVRSRTLEKYGMYSSSCGGASDARWMRISRVYAGGLFEGSGKVIFQVGRLWGRNTTRLKR